MLGLGTMVILARRAKAYDPRKPRRPAGGFARVLAYALFVSVVLGGLAARSAQADTAEAARGLGRDLLALSDLLGDQKTLVINGERLHVASSVVDTSLRETLDRFAEHCEKNPSVLSTGFEGATTDVLRLGTMRSGDDDEGAVLCVVASEHGSRDVAIALERFAATQDLGEIGKLRYAYARRAEGRTQVLTAWTDEKFSFKSLAAEGDADAPGADSQIVPRPEGGKRILSAEIARTTYAVRVYASPQSPEDTIAAYDGAMAERGFKRVHDRDKPRERAYIRDGFVVTMSATPAAEGARGSTLSFAELGQNSAGD